jgi:cyclopropane fatty-acyl-phospholipid synthase-like methyltransferase
MRRVVYWRSKQRLVYLHENATPEYWDQYWRSEGKAPAAGWLNEIVSITSKHLRPGARVLEGGCGRADKVKAMAEAGFDAVGVDFAEQVVKQAFVDYPGLDVRLGDVRSLALEDESFDAYWSIGVIEHFWNGYGDILTEAARVLRPGGLLFLTAPWLSPYRRYKAHAGGYPVADYHAEPDSFFQFALSRDEVCQQLRRAGFEIEKWRGIASAVSLQEDMATLRRPIDWLLGSRGPLVKRVFRRVLLQGLNICCGHSFLAIARRRWQ